MTVLAGIVALLALAAVVASLAYLHLAPTGLAPVRDAVSQYGITPFRSGYRVATLAFAAAGLALAVGIATATHGRGRAQAVVLLLIFAVARAAISWFPMDAPGNGRTATGRTHGWLAVAAFGGVTLTALRLGNVLARQARWHPLGPMSTALGWLMLALLITMALARFGRAVRAVFGAVERAFYVTAIGWFAVFAIACAAVPR